MKVKAIKKGYDGDRLREEGEVFFFEGYKKNEDGSDNLGSWMEPVEEAKPAKSKPAKS